MSDSRVIDSWIAELAQQPRRRRSYEGPIAAGRDRASVANRPSVRVWAVEHAGIEPRRCA